jgi:hypothetical protein
MVSAAWWWLVAAARRGTRRGATIPATEPHYRLRIGKYVRRWRRWVRSGLDGYDLKLAVVKPSPYAAADKLPQGQAVLNPRA